MELLLAAHKKELRARWKLGMSIVNGMSAQEQAFLRYSWLVALDEMRLAQEGYWAADGL